MVLHATYLAGVQYFPTDMHQRDQDFITPGVISDQDLVVSAASPASMAVHVSGAPQGSVGGNAWLPGGYRVYNDAQATLTITAAHSTHPRVDLILATIDTNATPYVSVLKVIIGAPASSPVAPAVPAGLIALALARVAVAANATTIITANITDVRVVAGLQGNGSNLINLPLPSPGEIGAATAAQGAKADSALQTVQLGQTGGVAKQDDLAAYKADNAKYIPTTYRGLDIADILQATFDRSDVGDIQMYTGEYLLGHKVTIPPGKTLLMVGNNGSNYVKNSQVSDKVFTKIKPVFDGDYCFKVTDRAGINNGFINCESMTSGGGIELDFSQDLVMNVNINTLVSGSSCTHPDLCGIFMNCDRPSGTTPGGGYFININIGGIDFGKLIYLKRHDTYTTLGSTINDYVAVVGININGKASSCQRHVYYDSPIATNHGGTSSNIALLLEGGYVPDSMIPVIDINAADCILNCEFHDINEESWALQHMRYRLGSSAINTMILTPQCVKGSASIIDLSTGTKYLSDSIPEEFTLRLKLQNGVGYYFGVTGSEAAWVLADGSINTTSTIISGNASNNKNIFLTLKHPKLAVLYISSLTYINVKELPRKMVSLEIGNCRQLHGDIKDLPYLDTLKLNAVNAVSAIFTGDLSDLPPLTGVLEIYEDGGTITGSLADLPKISGLGLTCTSVTGALSDLPSTIVSELIIKSNSNITGSIASLPPVTGQISFYNCALLTGALSATTQSTNINLSNMPAMSQADTDNTIINLDTGGKLNGTLVTHLAHSATSLTSYNNLITKGWTITHD